jgi:hypothetical protein
MSRRARDSRPYVAMPHPNRQIWRENLLKAISAVMEAYETPQEVHQLLLEGIRQSIHQHHAMSSAVSPRVSAIASTQGAIGWQHIMKGSLANEWRQDQQTSMQGRETKYKNAQTWSTTIIQTILGQWLELWAIRNKDRHGRDWQTQNTAAKDQATREITQLYEYKGRIMPQHEWIFSNTLEQQRQKSTYVQRAFISNYKPVILASYQTRLETG